MLGGNGMEDWSEQLEQYDVSSRHRLLDPVGCSCGGSDPDFAAADPIGFAAP